MRYLLLSICAALLATGCATISTELDPGGSPKYRRASSGTGTNIARRFTAQDMPAVRTMHQDDIDQMLRQGRNPGKGFE